MWKPMLANNKQPDLDKIVFPQLASRKMDGVRIIFYKGKILSRSLKEIPNKQLKQKFEPIRKYTEDNKLILDGEGYSPNLTFQQIISFCMTEDFEDKKSIKKFGEILSIPDCLKFYCYDAIMEGFEKDCFNNRQPHISIAVNKNNNIMSCVNQVLVRNKQEVEKLFKCTLNEGFEGLILKNPEGHYKCGRTTLKENLMFKLKPFVTFDAEILDVIQATKVDPNAEKKINELGRSVTSKKKGDRILIEKASAFLVKYEGKDIKVVLSMTDEEKIDIWANRASYIGKIIEYKGMLIGAKDVPRHPVMIRFREDK